MHVEAIGESGHGAAVRRDLSVDEAPQPAEPAVMAEVRGGAHVGTYSLAVDNMQAWRVPRFTILITSALTLSACGPMPGEPTSSTSTGAPTSSSGESSSSSSTGDASTIEPTTDDPTSVTPTSGSSSTGDADPLFAFLTSTTVAGGAVGGQGGADWLCRDLAVVADLPRALEYVAWLGGPLLPIDRVDDVPSGWLSTCTGEALGAASAGELHSVDPAALCDEAGDPAPGVSGLSPARGRGHWAGASADGTVTDGGTCGGWLDLERAGQAGSIDEPGPSWLSFASVPCTVPLSLLCVGQ